MPSLSTRSDAAGRGRRAWRRAGVGPVGRPTPGRRQQRGEAMQQLAVVRQPGSSDVEARRALALPGAPSGRPAERLLLGPSGRVRLSGAQATEPARRSGVSVWLWRRARARGRGHGAEDVALDPSLWGPKHTASSVREAAACGVNHVAPAALRPCAGTGRARCSTARWPTRRPRAASSCYLCWAASWAAWPWPSRCWRDRIPWVRTAGVGAWRLLGTPAALTLRPAAAAHPAPATPQESSGGRGHRCRARPPACLACARRRRVAVAAEPGRGVRGPAGLHAAAALPPVVLEARGGRGAARL